MTTSLLEEERDADPSRPQAQLALWLPDQWALWPSTSGLGQWIIYVNDNGTLLAFAPPGIALHERWDSTDLFEWRQATWQSLDHVDLAPPAETVRLASLGEALTRVPGNAIEGLNLHRWMIKATEAHADALERLAQLQEHEPGSQTAEAVAALREVAARHRFEATECSRRARPSRPSDPTPHDLASAIANDPQGLLARIEELLDRSQHLSGLCASLTELADQYGTLTVLEAVASLAFAKQNSQSWRVTHYVRESRLVARRATRHMKSELRHVKARLATSLSHANS
jgi:hypothetical protein